jgi:predicted Fe-Mo cluster-binding NifX family protein
MKIAVSAAGPNLDSQIDPRFGRCPYLLIVDSESMSFAAVENAAAIAPGGAGIQAAELVAKMGAMAVITGDCGPNAYEVLSAAGIDVFAGVSGSVREAVERFRDGGLRTAPGPSAESHAGTRPGMGRGAGGGMGAGMGRGGSGPGGGMERGRGSSMGGGRGGGMGRGMGRSGSDPGGGMSRGRGSGRGAGGRGGQR